jgi:hypothetical protein
MRTYHVVTPFSRFENLERIVRMLEGRPVMWHPIFDEGLAFDVEFKQDWIKKSYSPKSVPFWLMWADSMNRFITAGGLVQDDRYCILNDDDFYEPDFFDKVDKHDGELVICSMKRGHHTPAGVAAERAHGTDTLTGRPEEMCVGRVGAEQIIVSGRIFATMGFTGGVAADGECIVQTAAKHPVDYCPEAFVWFNFLEPGRWAA